MIVLIDGPLGVGKTTVGHLLKEYISGYDVLFMDADAHEYVSFYTLNPKKGDVLGTSIRYHTTFCRNFGMEVNKQADLHDIVIVPMCMEGKAAKECVADYLKKNRIDVKHVILTISKNELIKRIEKDSNKSRMKKYSLIEYDDCMQYINMYYKEYVLNINTDSITAEEAASRIIKEILKKDKSL